MVITNNENAHIAEALLAKLNITEQFLVDSIKFEKTLTVPLRYDTSNPSIQHYDYVGDVSSHARIRYNGKEYSGIGTFLYTYGTRITIESSAIEMDDIPSRAKKVETIIINKDNLFDPLNLRHTLTIIENRGRYAGYGAQITFNYSFFVDRPKYPSDNQLFEVMLEAYNTALEDENKKDVILEYIFKPIHSCSVEELLHSKTDTYNCIKEYDIDLMVECQRIKKLIKNKDNSDVAIKVRN